MNLLWSPNDCLVSFMWGKNALSLLFQRVEDCQKTGLGETSGVQLIIIQAMKSLASDWLTGMQLFCNLKTNNTADGVPRQISTVCSSAPPSPTECKTNELLSQITCSAMLLNCISHFE